MSQNRSLLSLQFQVLLLATFQSLLFFVYLHPKASPYEVDHRRLEDVAVFAQDKEAFLQHLDSEHLPLLNVSTFSVLGPSHFPKPTDMIDREHIIPYLEPTFGTHRADQDAVLLFAAEYPLKIYALFIGSLRETGYQGDIVLAISTIDDQSVVDYLKSDPHVVVYQIKFSCFNAEWEAVDSAKGGMRVCLCHNLYGRQATDDKGKPTGTVEPLQDPRPARTLATTRYELYWIWALHYNPHAYIMLIDARDTYFQRNPFADLPREPDAKRPNGVLHFFGENVDATRIGKSPKNRKWLTNAYGETVVAALEDKPTICSGSTLGEQIAIETYLRAMVAESDETGTKLMGADQGFHNYLYYSNKLANALAIRSITVFDEGRGTINNLGALRTKELHEWGDGKIVNNSTQVLNWDGSLSAVVHQFDRHKILSDYYYGPVATKYKDEWVKARDTKNR